MPLSIHDPEHDIITLTLAEIAATVQVHRQVFPDYFLTHMGQNFLERFYKLFIDRPGYGYIAKDKDKIIGFVTGTTELHGFYNRFYRDNFAALVLIVAARFVSDRFVRQNIMARAGHVRNALSAFLRPKQDYGAPLPASQDTPQQIAHLLSIGVAEEYRGQGIAEALTDHFCTELRRDGIEAVYLSVFADNYRAIRFYEKNGWKQTADEGDSLIFFRSLAI